MNGESGENFLVHVLSGIGSDFARKGSDGVADFCIGPFEPFSRFSSLPIASLLPSLSLSYLCCYHKEQLSTLPCLRYSLLMISFGTVEQARKQQSVRVFFFWGGWVGVVVGQKSVRV